MDVCVAFFSLLLAYQLRFNFRVPRWKYPPSATCFRWCLGVRLLGFLVSGTYRVQLRFTATDDVFRLLVTIFVGTVVLALVNPVYQVFNTICLVPYSILIIEFLVSIFFWCACACSSKCCLRALPTAASARKEIIIYGAGESGLITKRTLETDRENNFKVVAFIDENRRFENKKLEDVKVWLPENLERIFKAYPNAELIISKQSIDPDKRSQIIEKALEHEIKVLNVPSIKSWINGQLNVKQLRNLKIEDLLERDPIELDTEKLSRTYGNKVILVTGAAGSIGSELVMQLMAYRPLKLIFGGPSNT